MRVLFSGTPAVALPSLRALMDSHHEVVGVLTRPPAPVGRKRTLTPSPVHQFATDHGLPVITADRPHEPETMERIERTGAQVSAVVAYGALLREPALSALPHGWINLHFSLLPAWRGAAPVQHAIRAGDTTTGVSTFQIEAGLDTGPILATREHPIGPRDTAGEVLDALAHLGAPVLVHTLDQIEAGTATPRPQPSAGISHAPRITSADARVEWTGTAEQVDRQIRATTPAPGAWTTYAGRRIKLAPVLPAPGRLDLPPGALHHEDGEVLVGTVTHPVRLTEVAPAGKGWMDAADWARGARLEPGAELGTTDG